MSLGLFPHGRACAWRFVCADTVSDAVSASHLGGVPSMTAIIFPRCYYFCNCKRPKHRTLCVSIVRLSQEHQLHTYLWPPVISHAYTCARGRARGEREHACKQLYQRTCVFWFVFFPAACFLPNWLLNDRYGSHLCEILFQYLICKIR